MHFQEKYTHSSHSPVFCFNDSVLFFFLCVLSSRSHIDIYSNSNSKKKIHRKNHKNGESIDSCWHSCISRIELNLCISNELTVMILLQLSWLKLILQVGWMLTLSIIQFSDKRKSSAIDWCHTFQMGGNFSKFQAMLLLASQKKKKTTTTVNYKFVIYQIGNWFPTHNFASVAQIVIICTI